MTANLTNRIFYKILYSLLPNRHRCSWNFGAYYVIDGAAFRLLKHFWSKSILASIMRKSTKFYIWFRLNWNMYEIDFSVLRLGGGAVLRRGYAKLGFCCTSSWTFVSCCTQTEILYHYIMVQMAQQAALFSRLRV